MKQNLASAKLNVAVLGLGSIGLRHAKNLLSLGHQVFGYDPSDEKQSLAQREGVVVCKAREEALLQASHAIIASPNFMHLEDLRACVSNDVHTMVEKPLAHDISALLPVLKEVENKNLLICCAFNLRFRNVVQAVHNMLKDGVVGDILWGRFICSSYLPQWRPDQDYRKGYTADSLSGGVLFDIIHEFDLANYLIGSASVVSAYADTSGYLDIQTEDRAFVVLAHDEGKAVSHLHLDYVSPARQRVCEISGSKGRIVADLRSGEINTWDAEGRRCATERHEIDANAEYIAEVKDFLSQKPDGNAKLLCSVQQGVEVLQQVVDARRLSGVAA